MPNIDSGVGRAHVGLHKIDKRRPDGEKNCAEASSNRDNRIRRVSRLLESKSFRRSLPGSASRR